MTVLTFTLWTLLTGLFAGFVGSLTGLGGGLVVTPVLTLLLGVDIKYAIGASLIATIATSSGSAAAYVRDGLSNIRVGMLLEIATVFGALFGAYLGSVISTRTLSIVFGLVMLQTAYQSARARHEAKGDLEPDPLSVRLGLGGEYRTPQGMVAYHVYRVRLGFLLMFGAGTFSGLLGIGSGSLKVPAMDLAMRLPFKVSTATSNFMIGVTAAASAGVYLGRGQIEPNVALPVMLSVLGGSMLGAKLLPHLPVRTLRLGFAVLVSFTAVTMIYKGVRGL